MSFYYKQFSSWDNSVFFSSVFYFVDSFVTDNTLQCGWICVHHYACSTGKIFLKYFLETRKPHHCVLPATRRFRRSIYWVLIIVSHEWMTIVSSLSVQRGLMSPYFFLEHQNKLRRSHFLFHKVLINREFRDDLDPFETGGTYITMYVVMKEIFLEFLATSQHFKISTCSLVLHT